MPEIKTTLIRKKHNNIWLAKITTPIILKYYLETLELSDETKDRQLNQPLIISQTHVKDLPNNVLFLKYLCLTKKQPTWSW